MPSVVRLVPAWQGPQKWIKGIQAVHAEHLVWVSIARTDSQMDVRVDRHVDAHVKVGKLSLNKEERSWLVG